MRILIVDDEEYQRLDLRDALEKIVPGSEFTLADEYGSAMKAVEGTTFDVAFLDIQMPGKNGLTLAGDIKRKQPGCNIVMVTAYEQYALDAFRLFASGYILKPFSEDELKQVLDNLRKPVDRPARRLEVRCFGNFDVFLDGKPVSFKRKKEKELLAYLICLKGASATRGEICGNILDGSGNIQTDFAYFRMIVSSLKKDLNKLGFDDVFIHGSNSYSVNTDLLDCDYYEYLKGEASPSNSYAGSFMNQYAWAEEYIWALENY